MTMSDDAKRLAAGVARRGRAAADALRGVPPPAPEPPPSAPPRPAGWWELLPFTTHDIELVPGLRTMAGDHGVDTFDDVRVDAVVDACGGDLAGRTVVDLGCLEGGFTLALAERDAALAVGIEARRISVERCELARRLRGTARVEFVEADIKDELGRRDPFDVVFAAGILYHVADPAALLTTMRESCRHVTLIDTHVAREDGPSHGCSEVMTVELATGTYRGRRFGEFDPDADVRDDLLWAAWSDTDAFWPLEEDLVEMIRAAGFAIAERLDPIADGHRDRWGVDHRNRVLYRAWV